MVGGEGPGGGTPDGLQPGPGPVSVRPMPTPDDSGPTPVELYKMAVEEMRFQVSHNWSRTQYLLGFNAAILTAGAAVATQEGRSAAMVFVVGLVASVLSAAAVRTQHEYYRTARNRMVAIEEEVVTRPAYRINTTTSLGGSPRAVSVTQVVYLLFGVMAIVNVIGFVTILAARN